jgi:hypothetical protein
MTAHEKARPDSPARRLTGATAAAAGVVAAEPSTPLSGPEIDSKANDDQTKP